MDPFLLLGAFLLFSGGKKQVDAPPPPRPSGDPGRDPGAGFGDLFKKAGPWGAVLAAVAAGFKALQAFLGVPLERLARVWGVVVPDRAGDVMPLIGDEYRKWARLQAFSDELAVMLHRHQEQGGAPTILAVERTWQGGGFVTETVSRSIVEVMVDHLAYFHVGQGTFPWQAELTIRPKVAVPHAPWASLAELAADPLVAEGRHKWARNAPGNSHPRAHTFQPKAGAFIDSETYYKGNSDVLRPSEYRIALREDVRDTWGGTGDGGGRGRLTQIPTLPQAEGDADRIVSHWKFAPTRAPQSSADLMTQPDASKPMAPPRMVWHAFKAAYAADYGFPDWSRSDLTFIPRPAPPVYELADETPGQIVGVSL